MVANSDVQTLFVFGYYFVIVELPNVIELLVLINVPASAPVRGVQPLCKRTSASQNLRPAAGAAKGGICANFLGLLSRRMSDLTIQKREYATLRVTVCTAVAAV